MVKYFAGETITDEAKLAEVGRRPYLAHHRECDFYSTFGRLGLFPLVDVYFTQKLCTETAGIIFMQDMTEGA